MLDISHLQVEQEDDEGQFGPLNTALNNIAEFIYLWQPEISNCCKLMWSCDFAFYDFDFY